MTWFWQRPPVPISEVSPDRLQANVLIHLGRAWGAHQEGHTLLAIRHLRIAAQAILVLIESWSAQEVSDGAE